MGIWRWISDRKIYLRTGHRILPICELEVEQRERDRIDVRSIACNLRSSGRRRVCTELSAESGGRTVRGELRQINRDLVAFTVAGTKTLISAAKKNVLSRQIGPPISASKLVLLQRPGEAGPSASKRSCWH